MPVRADPGLRADTGLQGLPCRRAEHAVSPESGGLLQRHDGLGGEVAVAAVGSAQPVAEVAEPPLHAAHVGARVTGVQGAALGGVGFTVGAGLVVGEGFVVGFVVGPGVVGAAVVVGAGTVVEVAAGGVVALGALAVGLGTTGVVASGDVGSGVAAAWSAAGSMNPQPLVTRGGRQGGRHQRRGQRLRRQAPARARIPCSLPVRAGSVPLRVCPR